MPANTYLRNSRPNSALSTWWNNLRFIWYTRKKLPWIAAILSCALFTGVVMAVLEQKSQALEKKELNCLALNVYYESRGEPLAGQRAVAEVTMNRVASRHYPKTVCEVVYQKNWDRLRKRLVGAFSWTEFDTVQLPRGQDWQEAREVAEAVYFKRHAAMLEGALHYHAVYIRPSWARKQRPIARIGRHVFYK